MPNNLTADPRALSEPTEGRKSLSSLCREIGLAAVAIELNLELSTLQSDAAEAIEQGTAALFDAGYGPSLIGHRRRVWASRVSAMLGFLLAGAAASNAGEPSRTLTHKPHAHRVAHHQTVDPRAREDAPVIGSELKTGVPLGAWSLVPETDEVDSPGGCLWGLNRYNGVSCP
jgi:hypothetical protein